MPSELRVRPLALDDTLADLALGAGGRLVEACIGLAVPGRPIRPLVAEDRSAEGVRDQTGPDPRSALGPHPMGKTADNSGHERSPNARQCRRSLDLWPPDLGRGRQATWSSSLPTSRCHAGPGRSAGPSTAIARLPRSWTTPRARADSCERYFPCPSGWSFASIPSSRSRMRSSRLARSCSAFCSTK
jgi:hypothetical protein